MGIRKWCAGWWSDARRTINIEESHGTDKLQRNLGLISIVLFTITQAVGSGILTTPGIISNNYAGSWAFLSFLYAGLVCAPAALCLAKMASITAKSGSTGSYACMVLGQFIGMLMFFDVMLECIGGTAAVAVSQADHIKLILRLSWGLHLPDAYTKTPADVEWLLLAGALICTIAGSIVSSFGWRRVRKAGSKDLWSRQGALGVLALNVGLLLAGAGIACAAGFIVTLPSINLLSVAVIGMVTFVLLRGIRETKVLTNLLTVTKIVLIAIIVVVFAGHFNWANINRPIPPNLPGALAGASMAFFAYVGIDLATTAAGETRNAKRNVPLGMLIGLAAVTVLYVAAAFFLNAALPYELLAKGDGEAAPMAHGLEILGYTSAAIWVAAGSTLTLFSVVLASAYSTTRLVYNMAQHKLLPPLFEKVDEKTQVPVPATLVVSATIALLTGTLAVGELMHLTNIGTMTAFITISLTVLVKTVRETRWRGSAPEVLGGCFWVAVGALGILGPARLMIELPVEAFIRLVVVWLAVALLFTFYSRHRSLASAPSDSESDDEEPHRP